MTGFRWLLWSRTRAVKTGAVLLVVLAFLAAVAVTTVVGSLPSPGVPTPAARTTRATTPPVVTPPVPGAPDPAVAREQAARAQVEGYMLAWLRHPGNADQWAKQLTPYTTPAWLALIRNTDPGKLPKGAHKSVTVVDPPNEGTAVFLVVLTGGQRLRVTVEETKSPTRWLVGDVRPEGG